MVADRVHLESWRDRRTGGEGWGSSTDRPKLLFEGSGFKPNSEHFSPFVLFFLLRTCIQLL
jgi:hypothetical protein